MLVSDLLGHVSIIPVNSSGRIDIAIQLCLQPLLFSVHLTEQSPWASV